MEDGKKMFLERQWQLLDGNKKLRYQIPTITTSLNILIGSFYFKLLTDLKTSQWLFSLTILLITVFGLWALYSIQKQYNYSNSKIYYLYKNFKMNYLDDFTYASKEIDSGINYEAGTLLFIVGYVSMALIGSVISLSIFFST